MLAASPGAGLRKFAGRQNFAHEPTPAPAPRRLARGQIGLELTGLEEGEPPQLCRLLASVLAG